MIFLPQLTAQVKHTLKKVFRLTMLALNICITVLVPAYIGYYAYKAFEMGYPPVGWLFIGIAFLMVMTSYYERKYYKGFKEFERSKKWLTDRQILYQTCSNHRFDDLTKTVEAIKGAIKALKERDGEQSKEAVDTIKELMAKNDLVIAEINKYTKEVKDIIEDGKNIH